MCIMLEAKNKINKQCDIKEKAFRDRKKKHICFKDVCMGIIQPVWKEKIFVFQI